MQKTSHVFILAAILAIPSQALAWGETGHNAICNVASFLVTNPELKSFLKKRGEILGHLCNIPDISWRSDPNAKIGDGAHFMNPQNIGLTIEEVPTDFQEIYKKYEGKVYQNTRFPEYNSPKPVNVHEVLGSNWWRTEQLYKRAIYFAKGAIYESKKKADDLPYNVFATIPSNIAAVSSLQSSDPVTYNLYSMLSAMGIMGHFIGDASQPLHNASNYDGWNNGHGGIHAFYESAVVDELSYKDPENQVDLRTMVYQKAQEISKASPQLYPPLAANMDIVNRTKSLSVISSRDAEKLYALDRVSTPSTVEKLADGSLKRKPAVRGSAEQAAVVYKDMIIKQLALAALVLAKTWDELAQQAEPIPYARYRSYIYPLDVDFLPPNYIDDKTPITFE